MRCVRILYSIVNPLRTENMSQNTVTLGGMQMRRLFTRVFEPSTFGGRSTVSKSIFLRCTKYKTSLHIMKCYCTPDKVGSDPWLLTTPKTHYSSKSADSRIPKKFFKSDQKDDPDNPTITLLGADGAFYGHKPKAEAMNLAKKQGLLLTQVSEANVSVGKKYPVYKLMTAAQLQKEELKEQNQAQNKSKSVKKVHLSHKISSHDLSVKINTMKKWVEKDHEIHVMVTCGTPDDAKMLENIYQQIEKEIKSAEGRVLQKSLKNTILKFTITAIPQKK